MRHLKLLFFWFVPFVIFSQNQGQSDAIDFLRLNPVDGELESQWVSSIMQDNEGFIWIGTQDGLYKVFDNHTKTYQYNPKNKKSLPANWVRCMAQDSHGIFWIGTQGGGLVTFDQDTEQFEKYNFIDENDILNGLIIYDLFITSNNVLWIESENGLYRKTPDGITEKVSDVVLSVFIHEIKSGQIIISFNDTIFIYNNLEKILEPIFKVDHLKKVFYAGESNFILNIKDSIYTYTLGDTPVLLETPEKIYGISNRRNNSFLFLGKHYIYRYDVLKNTFQKLEILSALDNVLEVLQALFVDRQGILWMGTANGLFKESIAGRLFKEVIPVHARRIIADKEHVIIGGNQGLFKYSLATKSLTNLIEAKIFSVLKSTSGIWAGGIANNLYHINLKGEIKIYEILSKNKELFKIYGIVQDKNDFLWVSSWEGLHLLNLQGELIKSFRFNNDKLKALQLHIDKEDNLWIITVGNGIYKIPQVSQISAEQKLFSYKQYVAGQPVEKTINSNTAYEIFEAENGDLWFGMDSGINIYKNETDSFESLQINQQFFGKKTMAINSDTSGLFWISTIRNGVYVYDTKNDRMINFNTYDGLVSNACLFTSRLFYKDKLYLGTESGVQVIHATDFTFPEIHTKPIITDVNLYSKSTKSDTKFQIEKKNIKYLEHFEVSPIQSYFTLHFATIDYSFPKKLNYFYKLNDTDNLWHKAESNFINFTNLESGDYTFYVKAAYDILDDTPVASKKFTINSPWYKMTIAYVFYGMIFISILVAFSYLKLKQNLALNKLKAAKVLDEFKTKLYTNISHEFRTPLTLISGPIDNQLAKTDLSKTDKKELSLVKQNADRLLHLVNQMLDLSMIDSGQTKLRVSRGDLSILFKQLVSAFQYQANQKNITIKHQIFDLKDVWFDADVIEKVSSNLLSNAIKYAPKNSEIIFDALNLDGMLVLSIINSSKLVGKEDLSKLFQRFYQDNELSDGVGVGLALVRDLVTLSKGTIIANNIDANRIQFNVSLPINKDAFTAEEIYDRLKVENLSLETDELISEVNTNKSSLLIVEDETDIRAFIVSIFSDNYDILEAENGKIGLEKAQENLPDLIISDIMMPELDGIELCHGIKTNELTSHIPVILLTAKVGEHHEIEGLKTGADAYVTKPFSSEKLKIRVEKLIENRIKLQKHFSNTLTINPELAITSTETEFLKKLQLVLDTHISNSEFTSETFCKYMQISRTQLHRKLKAITGMTTSEFIRSQRLKLAVQLLKSSDATMAEIAYQVGFNSPSYFNKCFKEVY
ncbi:response regulator, partial [Xanthomarina sp. F2636L]|uniref:hybrid sensor histidine kinase/response regulator n=1 Tax=Xanthomarina sp. F2636L TaxID=2996018 RepID=UPI00225DDF53